MQVILAWRHGELTWLMWLLQSFMNGFSRRFTLKRSSIIFSSISWIRVLSSSSEPSEKSLGLLTSDGMVKYSTHPLIIFQ